MFQSDTEFYKTIEAARQHARAEAGQKSSSPDAASQSDGIGNHIRRISQCRRKSIMSTAAEAHSS